MAACRLGGKVLVVTVDPARRLANALGLEGIGNEEKPVPPEAFKSCGVRPRGELWAAMLDTKQSWDDLVRRHAPTGATAGRILGNPLYQNISGKFVQSHDYIAMERLYEIHSEGNFDLIVVDTPPTRNAIDFIEAPQRMAEFFSSRLLRLLIAPYRSRMVNMASRPFYQVADRVLGSQFLEDIAEFFILFQTMYPGFVERARAVERLLLDQRTTFVVVSTLEAAPVREAEFFIEVLTAKKFHLGALVLNKVLPDYLLDDAAEARAARLCDDAAELARSRRPGRPGRTTDEAQLSRVLAEVGENFRNFAVVARREAAQRHELEVRADVVAMRPRVRLRHPRPARSAPPRRADLDLGIEVERGGHARRTRRGAHRPGRRRRRPPAAPGRRLGRAVRPVLRGPAAVRPRRRTRVDRFVVLGQVRPTTSQTLHLEDLVGRVLDARGPAPAGPGLAPGQRRRRRGRHSEPQRARPAGLHPGALAGPAGGPDDQGVGARRSAAGPDSSSGCTSRSSIAWPA